MIEVRCSGCNALLRVRDELGGKSGACPKCKTRIRVPEPSPGFEIIEDDDDVPIVPARKAAAPAAPPAARTAVEDEAEEVRPRPVKRRKRRKSRFNDDDRIILILVAVGIVLCGVLTVLSYFHYLLTYFGMALAGIMAFVGQMWCYRVVREEGFGHSLLFRYVPFYGVFFLMTRWDDMWRPFFLNLTGGILLVVSFFVGHVIALQNPKNHAGVQNALMGKGAPALLNNNFNPPDDDAESDNNNK